MNTPEAKPAVSRYGVKRSSLLCRRTSCPEGDPHRAEEVEERDGAQVPDGEGGGAPDAVLPVERLRPDAVLPFRRAQRDVLLSHGDRPVRPRRPHSRPALRAVLRASLPQCPSGRCGGSCRRVRPPCRSGPAPRRLSGLAPAAPPPGPPRPGPAAGRAARRCPRPTVTPWSSSGSRAIRSSALACPGSPLACPASHQSGARNATRCADQRAGRRRRPRRGRPAASRTAHWSRNPVIAARSAPPTVASSCSWSPRTGRARRSASRIAAHLRIHARSSMACAAPPGHHGRVGPAQRRDQHGRRRRPADADVAEHDQVRAGVGLLVGDRPRPARKAGLGLLGRQRVLDVDPAAAAPHPVPYDLLGQRLRIAVQRHVDDAHRDAEPAGQHRRPGSPPSRTARTSSRGAARGPRPTRRARRPRGRPRTARHAAARSAAPAPRTVPPPATRPGRRGGPALRAARSDAPGAPRRHGARRRRDARSDR